MASASATPTSIPGAHPALGHISSKDQGGLVAVLAALAWTFILVAFSIRVYVRYKTGPWKRDDSCLAVATALSCAQTSIVFYLVNKGLGKADIPEQNLDTLQKANFANDLFYILILYLSKCCVGLLYLRLTPAKGHSVAVWAIMAGSSVWAAMSIMLISIRCHVGDPWATWSTECTNFFARWEVIGTLDIVTEMALFFMAIYLVHGLQMSLKAKTIVVAAFAARILVIPAAGVRLHYLNPSVLPSHRNLGDAYAVICAQLELGYGLMAATVPCLKPFIAVYEGPKHPTSYYNRSYGSDRDYNLKSFNSAQLKSQGTVISTVEAIPSPARESIGGTRAREGGFRPETTTYTATVSHRDPRVHGHGAGRNERSSDDSRQMIIEQKTGWSIEYDASSERGNGTSVNDREMGREVGSAV